MQSNLTEGVMSCLPFRATVFLRPASERSLATLIERAFARETDAVTWCRVMTEAQPNASGVWFVCALQRGRVMNLMRDSGIEEAMDALSREPVAGMPLLASSNDLSDAEVRELAEDNPVDDLDDAQERQVVQILAGAAAGAEMPLAVLV